MYETTLDHHTPAHRRGGKRILNLDHLRQYTQDNPELELELLTLFRNQLKVFATDLRQAQTAGDWRFATHSLKGSAQSMGAEIISEIAIGLEGHSAPLYPAAKDKLLVPLDHAIAAFEAEVSSLLA